MKDNPVISITPIPHTNLVRIDSHGRWTRADIRTAIETLRRIIAQHGQIAILETISTPGTDYAALVWDDLAVTFEHSGEVSRVAVVGQEARIDVFSTMFRDDFGIDTCCFAVAQFDEAVAWLKGSPIHERRTDLPGRVLLRSLGDDVARFRDRCRSDQPEPAL